MNASFQIFFAWKAWVLKREQLTFWNFAPDSAPPAPVVALIYPWSVTVLCAAPLLPSPPSNKITAC